MYAICRHFSILANWAKTVISCGFPKKISRRENTFAHRKSSFIFLDCKDSIYLADLQQIKNFFFFIYE